MISLKHIKIYEDYNGDVDMWSRMNEKNEKEMTGETWNQIELFIQNLIIIKNGLASKTFEDETFNKLKGSCENDEVINRLFDIAKNYESE